MKAELAALNAKKEKLLAEYKTARSEAQEYETVKKNVDTLLSVPKDDEPKRTHHIE
jgi:predicted transcriptional regulator